MNTVEKIKNPKTDEKKSVGIFVAPDRVSSSESYFLRLVALWGNVL